MQNETYISELEEKAIDGDSNAAKVVYEYYRKENPETADYWKQYMDPSDLKQEDPVAEENDYHETTAQMWLKEYRTHSMNLMTIRELLDKCQEGNPFAYMAFADQYLNSPQKTEEQFQY